MNPLIKELIKEAGIPEENIHLLGLGYVESGEVLLEYLCKVVIQECIDCLNPKGIPNFTTEELKEHFNI